MGFALRGRNGGVGALILGTKYLDGLDTDPACLKPMAGFTPGAGGGAHHQPFRLNLSSRRL